MVVIKYSAADHLGSTRVVTDGTGCAVWRTDYLPFGETILAGGGSLRLNATGGGKCATNGYVASMAPARVQFTGKERDGETGLDYFGARYMSSAQGRFTSVDPIWVTKERLADPQRLNLYAYGRNNPLRFIDPDGMDVTLRTCSTGSQQECFQQVQAGLKKDDRAHVQLVQGNGANGFKRGEYGIAVDSEYKSDSKNFQALHTLAGDHSATARIDVLKANDKFQVSVEVQRNLQTGQSTFATMTMTPGQDGGFAGYTFFPSGKGVPGPNSTGNFTDVVVNASRGDVPETIQHELRHVLLGDFGRKAPYGAHGTGNVDRQTTEAEKEASKNKGTP